MLHSPHTKSSVDSARSQRRGDTAWTSKDFMKDSDVEVETLRRVDPTTTWKQALSHARASYRAPTLTSSGR